MDTITFQPFAGIRKNAIDYLNDVYVRKSQIKYDINYPMMFHDYFEMELILSGKAIFSLPGSDGIVLLPGSVYFTSPVHAHAVSFEKNTVLFNVSFAGNLLPDRISDILKERSKPLLAAFGQDGFGAISDMFEQTLTEFSTHLPMYKTVISNIVQNIIIMLLRLAPDDSENSASLAQQCLFIIHNNFKENLSLADVAATLNVTASYLGKLFKKNFNCSFSNYLNSLKISYAQSMLAATNSSIRKIALTSGFQSVEYFNYIFKKHTNLSPSEYRKSFPDIETQLREFLARP